MVMRVRAAKDALVAMRSGKPEPAIIAEYDDARQHPLNATPSSHGARFSNDAGVGR